VNAHETESRRAATGVALAVASFGLWGLLPVYFKAVGMLPATEVLGHRVVWSVAWTALLLTALVQWREVRAAFANPRMLVTLSGSALLISINWLIFIWAVANDRVLEASLGYFITPLFNVLLGRIVLGEVLGRVRGLAVALAGVGVGWMLWQAGVFPWVALSLGALFAGYGLVRKMAPVGAATGLFVETTLLAPFAALYLGWLAWQGSGALGTVDPMFDLVLVAAGLVTAAPLILFAGAARRLRMATVGLLFYMTPTLQMLLAVLAFGEPFTRDHVVTFACIWTALALYSGRSLYQHNIERMHPETRT
jgi:chloramphenicol-sensitive protein RarD